MSGNKTILRYFVTDRWCEITDDNDVTICPFAQTDVINTILSWIDPNLDSAYSETLKQYLEGLKSSLSEDPTVKEKINSLDVPSLVDVFNKNLAELKRQKYINPLMNAVWSLSKEDLAEMWESLIYLTWLKRKITFTEESVWGPVDVAIISKWDWLIWIKRKHYFDSEMNPQFIQNYLHN